MQELPLHLHRQLDAALFARLNWPLIMPSAIVAERPYKISIHHIYPRCGEEAWNKSTLMDRQPVLHLMKQAKTKGCKLRQHIITVLCYLLRLPFALSSIARRPFTRRARQHPRSIVVIKPCCLGDLLMTTPLLEVKMMPSSPPVTKVPLA